MPNYTAWHVCEQLEDMGEVWPTGHITELCLQLTASSRPANGDEHQALGSQSCERVLLTMGDLPFFT